MPAAHVVRAAAESGARSHTLEKSFSAGPRVTTYSSHSCVVTSVGFARAASGRRRQSEHAHRHTGTSLFASVPIVCDMTAVKNSADAPPMDCVSSDSCA
jgi:hypothetical protein